MEHSQVSMFIEGQTKAETSVMNRSPTVPGSVVLSFHEVVMNNSSDGSEGRTLGCVSCQSHWPQCSMHISYRSDNRVCVR